ncbi:protein kinase [Mucilaginibacter mali]|uniref:Protein kinase n=1 Tax=Mucilaginibacter mali TaxID=2740462 RepID=A0A7D4Q0J6_9SPHI|nr:lanthionine synthetase LanC family protein [Mucilaginibacter mali]QKJ28407.1 protein kinase [Mucilaginibacter mali]
MEQPAFKPDGVTSTDAAESPLRSRPLVGYDFYLEKSGLDFISDGGYLRVGNFQSESGWVLYISIVKKQFALLFEAVLPFLNSANVTFFIPENAGVHSMILDGGLGLNQTGKVIIIQVSNKESLPIIAGQLVKSTEKFLGPAIPGAKLIGSCVYTEYRVSPPGTEGLKFDNDLRWPFKKISPEPLAKKTKWLKRKYLIASMIKGDIKGNVYKGLNFSQWSNIKWCIIKQGNANQCYDDADRTIRDRLEWQFHVQSALDGKVALPKVSDFFELERSTYLVMEFIEGNSLYDMFNGLQGGTAWFALETQNKIAIINYLLQTLDILGKFHSNGFIHRDLSPLNFMVTADNNVIAIDIELCFNYLTNQPNPAFTLGTPGYMSPEQIRSNIPCVEDDIYGIGGLILRAFTGLSPTKFNPDDKEKLYLDLMYHLQNQRIVTLICLCLDNDAGKRPTLDRIRHCLEVYSSTVLTESKGVNSNYKSEAEQNFVSMFTDVLLSYQKYPLLGKNSTWYAKSENEDNIISNEFKSYSWFPGFYSGTCGIVYLLALADHYGYDLSDNRDFLYSNLDLVTAYYQETMVPECGLLNGLSGFCVAKALLIKYDLFGRHIANFDNISSQLSQVNDQINLANGVAGQGIAMLLCADLLKFPAFASSAGNIANQLMREQHNDGSWSINKDNTSKKGVKHTGLFYGIAGITYFLLEYGVRYCSEESKAAATAALGWLLKNRRSENGRLIWSVNSNGQSVNPWLEYGFTGVAWLFIKASEILNDDAYYEAAKSALLSHPRFIASNYLSQANGLAGLGEVYLEAYRVSKEKEWFERASHIAAFLAHCAKIQEDGSTYWLDGSENLPTAGFMTGTGGILHFLLRFQHPEKIGFHLFSI